MVPHCHSSESVVRTLAHFTFKLYTVTYVESAKLLFIENKVNISAFVTGAFHKIEYVLYRIKQAV